MMHIQPSDNWMNTHDARLSQDAQHRRVAEVEAAVHEFGHRFAEFTQKAIQMDAYETSGRELARNALIDGTLESPENLAAAANHLLTFGI
jgi:hypothetical protein